MGKVFITGASGFIGRTLCVKLASLGYEVIGIDSSHGDITGKSLFLKYESEKIEHVFHLASKSFVPDSWTDSYSFYNTNVLGTQNVLEFCRKKNISMTYVSAYIYGIPEKLPIAENDKISPNNPYAHSKHLAEQLCEFYCREFNLNVTVLRPFNVYGPGQRDMFLIPKILKQAIKNSSIQVMDLSPRRDYVYINDLVDALTLSIACENKFSIYNIGSGTSISVQEIIDAIQKVLNTDKPICSDMQIRKNEIPDVIADISKAKAELKWAPKISFIDGIERTINYR